MTTYLLTITPEMAEELTAWREEPDAPDGADLLLDLLIALDDTPQAAPILRDAAALRRIHEIMDGTEWHADTLDAIAEVLISTGREIREPGESHDPGDCPEGGADGPGCSGCIGAPR
jgi:hypothetical protein